MFSFLYLLFYLTLVGDSQKGKRKTSEQAVWSDSNTRSERQKKVMYSGGHSLDEDLEWSEPQTKDSGVDTCSSTTLNEERSHSDEVPRLQPAFQPAHVVFSVCSPSLITTGHNKRTGHFKSQCSILLRCRKEKQNN